jgi:hypothetical protein
MKYAISRKGMVVGHLELSSQQSNGKGKDSYGFLVFKLSSIYSKQMFEDIKDCLVEYNYDLRDVSGGIGGAGKGHHAFNPINRVSEFFSRRDNRAKKKMMGSAMVEI